jgi:hypothetical protein
VQDTTVIIQDREQKQDTGLAESGNMRAGEFTQSNNKIDYDIIEDIYTFMTNDNEFYRRNYFPVVDEFQNKGTTEKMMPMIDIAVEQYFKKFKVPARIENAINDEDKKVLMGKIIEIEKANKDV